MLVVALVGDDKSKQSVLISGTKGRAMQLLLESKSRAQVLREAPLPAIARSTLKEHATIGQPLKCRNRKAEPRQGIRRAFTQVVTEVPCFESTLIVRSGLHGEAYACIARD